MERGGCELSIATVCHGIIVSAAKLITNAVFRVVAVSTSKQRSGISWTVEKYAGQNRLVTGLVLNY